MRIFISSIAVLLTIAASGTGFSQLQSGTYLAPAEVRLKTAAYSEAFSALADEIEPKHYDVDGLAEALDYDIERAVDHVTKQITYDPYIGVMRGPSGTISASSGSSWDQAVLLAALINAMGGEAMLGVGKLRTNDATTLLKIGISTPTKSSKEITKIDVKEFLEKELNQTFSPPEFNPSSVSFLEYTEESNQIAARLLAHLRGLDDSLLQESESNASQYAQELAKNYVWVRYRDTPNDDWQVAHPAFQGLLTPTVEPEKFIAGTVPDEKLHKLNVRFYIERRANNRYSKVAITREYSRPVSNLAKAQIRLGISPNTPNSNGKVLFYTPIIDGIVQEGTKSFTSLGSTISTEDAAAGPAIFTTVANNFGGALNELNKEGEEGKNSVQLTGIIVETTHIAPGGKQTRSTRRLADFRDRAPEKPGLEIVFDGILEVNIGAENGARDLKSMLESFSVMARQFPYQLALLEKKISIEDLTRHPSSAIRPSHGWLPALQLSNKFEASRVGGRVVRTSPLVIMRRLLPSRDSGFLAIVDIQHNESRAFALRGENSTPVESPELAIRQGVWETLIEGELIGVSKIQDWKKSDQLRLISSVDELKSDPIWNASPRNTQDRLLADLNTSGSLLIPNNQIEHWWKVNTQTGQTLGMSKDGGSELTEYEQVLNVASYTVTGIFFSYGVASGASACQKVGNRTGSFTACCLASVTIMNGMFAGAGFIGSAAVGASYGAAMGAISSIGFDFFVGLVPTYGNAINGRSVDMCSAVFLR